MRLLLLSALLVVFQALPLSVHAQQDATAVLANLAQQAKEYQRTIPNFTCTEVVTTTAKRGEKLLRRIEFQADIRVQRKQDRSLKEEFLISSYMGKPRPAGAVPIIIYLDGVLDSGLPSFFDVAAQACYDYDEVGTRINFRADEAKAAKCHKDGTAGFAVFDAYGKLLHGEIRTPQEEAARDRHPNFASIDYVDVRLDDKLFRMPNHVYAEVLEKGVTRTFDAYYTSCKLYTVKTTIRPGDRTEPAQ